VGKKWAIGLIVLLVLIGALNLSLSLGLLSEPLKRATRAALARHFPQPVEVGLVRLSLIPARLILTDVKLPRPQKEEEPWAEVKEIHLSFSPWSLMTEVTVIKKIRLQEPRITLIQDVKSPDGSRWLPSFLGARPEATDAPRKAPGFVIRKIEIQKGSLTVRQDPQNLQVRLDELTGEILPDLRMENFQVDLSGANTTVQLHGKEKRFDHAQAKFSVHPDRLEIRSVELSKSDVRLTLNGSLENLNHPRYALALNAAFPLSELRDFLPLEWRLAGMTQLHAEVTGPSETVTISGDASINDLGLNDVPIGRIKTAFEYKNRHLQLTNLSSSALEGRAQGQAALDLSAPPMAYQLSLTFEQLSAGKLFALLGQKDIFTEQTLSGQIELAGQGFDRAKLSGKGTARLASPPDSSSSDAAPSDWKRWTGHWREVTADFEMDQGTLHLKETVIRTAESNAAIRGTIGPENELDLNFRLTSRKVEEFTPFMKMGFLHGALDLNGTVRGSLNDPDVKAAGSMRQAALRGRSFETITGRLSFRYPRLSFSSAHFKEKQALYALDGVVSFDPSLPHRPFFDLKAKITDGLPREVVAIFYRELPITSTVSGDLKAKGHPKKFEVIAGLTVGPGRLYGQEVDRGRLDLVVTHEKVAFNNVEAHYHDSVVTGEGWIQYNGHFMMAVSSTQTHLQDISWGNQYLRDLSAMLSGKLSGEGLLKNPTFKAQVQLHDITYRAHVLGAGTLDGNITDKVLSYEASLDNDIAAKGSLTLAEPFPFRMDLTLNHFEAKPFLTLLGSQYLENAAAVLSGTLASTGSLSRLQEVALQARLHQLSLDLGGYTLSNEEDIQVELQNQVVKIHSLRLKGEGTGLAINGSLELFKSYGLFINGEADLDLLRALSPEITYGRGKAYLALQVHDQWESPSIRGGMVVQDGTVKSETLKQAISIKSLGLSFNERQILLESFEGEVGGGKLLASGKWDVEGFAIGRFGLNLDLTGIRIATVTGLSGSMDASLFYYGNGGSKSLKGEVNIRRASYERRLDWQTWVVEFVKRDKTAREPIPVIGDTTLNIQVTGKENIRINNNLAKLPLELDLLIKGTLNHPVILGRIEARGGVISFRRNDFKILSGTVDFIDPDRTRPVLDVKATTRVRTTQNTYQINLSLIGPIDQFELSLSSDPPLKDETEILALLTFGKTPEEIAEASREIGASEAINVATGEIQETVEERVEAITGIDRIQIDPYYSSTKSAGTPRVTVSKRLWEDRFYVTYATTMDPSGEEIIQMEYVISNNISLVGGRDELGRVGGDLKFRFEFR
jgi:translocation and assembly module TamB